MSLELGCALQECACLVSVLLDSSIEVLVIHLDVGLGELSSFLGNGHIGVYNDVSFVVVHQNVWVARSGLDWHTDFLFDLHLNYSWHEHFILFLDLLVVVNLDLDKLLHKVRSLNFPWDVDFDEFGHSDRSLNDSLN